MLGDTLHLSIRSAARGFLLPAVLATLVGDTFDGKPKSGADYVRMVGG